ncbi:hypothetical protein UA32_12255 [Photobacterium angustum]|uniref:Uncharacterized protein n=1 Tax=Photobacterium angustum TaxID=661 RepID=A0ABX5GZ55_PHOAN|nr:hypothetical protein UA32_12255 [Photobacterium angustum]PSX03941.1 hypothetical protein C0W27_20825 [Photobacterium angustum]
MNSPHVINETQYGYEVQCDGFILNYDVRPETNLQYKLEGHDQFVSSPIKSVLCMSRGWQEAARRMTNFINGENVE